MNPYGTSQIGYAVTVPLVVVGTIMRVAMDSGVPVLDAEGTPQKNADGSFVLTDEPDGPTQLAQHLVYDVLLELPEGPVFVEKLRPTNDQYPSPLKVRLPAVGSPVLGARIGYQLIIWVHPMFDYAPCDSAAPGSASAVAAEVPMPQEPPRPTPGEVPYDPTKDPSVARASNAQIVLAVAALVPGAGDLV